MQNHQAGRAGVGLLPTRGHRLQQASISGGGEGGGQCTELRNGGDSALPQRPMQDNRAGCVASSEKSRRHNRFLWETRDVQLALGQVGSMARVARAQAYGSQVSLVQRPQWLVLASSVALDTSLSK